MRLPTVFAHVLLYNSDVAAAKCCLASLVGQEGFRLGENLQIVVSDNASTEDPLPALRAGASEEVQFRRNDFNLGFCGGHNWAAKAFLAGSAEYLLILNPDVKLAPTALAALAERGEDDHSAGLLSPKLLRANQRLEAVVPWKIDGCGICVTAALRHLDRGAEEDAENRYIADEYVFGGSGACLLLRRAAVQQLLLEGERFESDLARVYPQLYRTRLERAPLFDEAFFAYREDAELSWRAQLLGWRVRYVADALGYHVRNVTPERRSRLPKLLNRLGVRNRFLLQLNLVRTPPWAIRLHGLILRNIIVVLAVLFKEWSSLPALIEVWKLRRRAKERRRILFERAFDRADLIWEWFLLPPPYAVPTDDDSARHYESRKQQVAL